jgi:hypothetical protein
VAINVFFTPRSLAARASRRIRHIPNVCAMAWERPS